MKRKILAALLTAVICLQLVTSAVSATSANVAHNSGAPSNEDAYTVNVATTNTIGSFYVFGGDFPVLDSWTDMEQLKSVGYAFDIPYSVGNWDGYEYENVLHWNSVTQTDGYYSPFSTDSTTSVVNIGVSAGQLDPEHGTFQMTYTFDGTDTIAFVGTTILATTNGRINASDMGPLVITSSNGSNVNWETYGKCYVIYADNGVIKATESAHMDSTWNSTSGANLRQVDFTPYYVENGNFDPENVIAYAWSGICWAQIRSDDDLIAKVTYANGDYSRYGELDFPPSPLYKSAVSDFFVAYGRYLENEVGRYQATITENGKHTWSGLYEGGEIVVNVPKYNPGTSLKITENGTYNIAGYESVHVAVEQDVIIEGANMFQWLFDIAEGFLGFQIAPNFTIGGVMSIVVGLAIIVWLLKVFVGG